MAMRKIHEETAGKFMVRVYRDTPNREYVARIYVNDVWQPAADAFETECGAAIDTARAMLAHSVKQAAAPTEQPAEQPAPVAIDAAPQWCGLFPVYRAVLLDGTRKGREALMPEVARLCAAMDAMNAISSTLNDEQSQAFAKALAHGLTRCGY